MRPPETKSPDDAESPIDDAASVWVVRCDRGLTPAEDAELKRWISADPRHAEAMSRLGAAWSVLAAKPSAAVPESDAARARTTTMLRWTAWGGLAAAAMLAFAVFLRSRAPGPANRGESVAASAATNSPANRPRTLVLPDSTVVRLNVGAELVEQFTAAERRVQLVRGEAYFDVAKNPIHPFVVVARGAAVQAVGTAFNVQVQAGAVDVLVTEGRVIVVPPPVSPAVASGGAPAAPLVIAGYRAVVPLAAPIAGPRVVVTPTSATEVKRTLAWRESLFKLDGTTLAELAQRFERQTGRRIVLQDDAIAQLRVGGRLPADDVDGFVRVLEANYGVAVRREADGTIVLGAKP